MEKTNVIVSHVKNTFYLIQTELFDCLYISTLTTTSVVYSACLLQHQLYSTTTTGIKHSTC